MILSVQICVCVYIYIYICSTEICTGLYIYRLPYWLSGKESTCNAGDMGLIPGWGGFPRGEHGNPLQYSCLENPMDRGAWQATVHGLINSWT